MRLIELFEAANNEVAIIFGRFNPPHFGHVDAWKEAAKFPGWYVGTNQSTQGPKDPLPFDIKIKAMKTLYPEIEGHLVAEQSWFTLAVMVYKKYGEGATLHIVTDPVDKDVYVPMIQKQNGIEGPHGFYKFKSIEWARAERQSEASLVRKAVKENNPQDFETYSGVPANTVVAGQPYFELVRKFMLPYMEAEEAKLRKQQERDAAKAEKEKAKAAKKKVNEPVESLDEAPIEMDPADPMDPMIYGHDKANPAKLKYRMLRASNQIKDLASRVDNASPTEWQTMTRQFDELKMNVEQIRHALEELAKVRKKGGVRSRGIDKFIDSIEEGYGRYWCSTDKKWKTRKGPKQKRSS